MKNKKINRYVPEKVKDKIDTLDYKNKEHLYFICDMITRITVYVKTDDYNGYIDIPRTYFRDVIPNSKTLGEALDLLKNEEIILCDGIYVPGKKSLGYKFPDKYVSKLTTVQVSKLSKRIIKNKNDRNNIVNNKLKVYKNYFLNNFKIDYNKSVKYINQLYLKEVRQSDNVIKVINKYNQYFISVSIIRDGQLFFRRNKTNGRIDTNLTNLKSELKRFIIGGERLHSVDIVNSQPFFLSLSLDQNNPVYSKYIDWVTSGLFYENFELEYKRNTLKTINRKQIKNIMFCIFYSKNTSYRKEKALFRRLFPEVMDFIEQKKKIKHNALAIEMQQTESKMCIDNICQILDGEGIEYYTIHDSWIVDQDDLQRTLEILDEQFNKIYGRCPKFSNKKIK